MGDGGLCELFVDDSDQFRHVSDADNLFSILETWEECMNGEGSGASAASAAAFSPSSVGGAEATAVGAWPTANAWRREGDEEKGGGVGRGAQVQKKHKGSASPSAAAENEGAAKMSHITVERNRRKQMNEHLAVLRSLMPCFYVKRGDQASIIGGVVDYIKELQQVLHSLEATKYRKAYAEQVLSPRPASTASPPPHSPRPFIKSTPPLSPRLPVLISPLTPTPGSPYKPCGGGAGRLAHPAAACMSPAVTPTSSSSHSHEFSPQPFLPTLDSIVTELAAHAARPSEEAGGGSCLLLPDVKVEFAGPNLVLKTMSHRAPGQALKIIAALESLSLEILHVSISTVDDTMVHSFTIKIGVECELSAEELVQEIQQTFL